MRLPHWRSIILFEQECVCRPSDPATSTYVVMTDRKRMASRRRRKGRTLATRGKSRKGGRKTKRKKAGNRLKPIRGSAKNQEFDSVKGPVTQQQIPKQRQVKEKIGYRPIHARRINRLSDHMCYIYRPLSYSIAQTLSLTMQTTSMRRFCSKYPRESLIWKKKCLHGLIPSQCQQPEQLHL